MSCEKCKKRRCKQSANHLRAIFFAMARPGEIIVVCHDFEPNYYHGLEGVYA